MTCEVCVELIRHTAALGRPKVDLLHFWHEPEHSCREAGRPTDTRHADDGARANWGHLGQSREVLDVPYPTRQADLPVHREVRSGSGVDPQCVDPETDDAALFNQQPGRSDTESRKPESIMSDGWSPPIRAQEDGAACCNFAMLAFMKGDIGLT